VRQAPPDDEDVVGAGALEVVAAGFEAALVVVGATEWLVIGCSGLLGGTTTEVVAAFCDVVGAASLVAVGVATMEVDVSIATEVLDVESQGISSKQTSGSTSSSSFARSGWQHESQKVVLCLEAQLNRS